MVELSSFEIEIVVFSLGAIFAYSILSLLLTVGRRRGETQPRGAYTPVPDHPANSSSLNLEIAGESTRVGRSKFRNGLGRFATRLVFSIALVLASLRDYLLGDGLFLYRDWSWPLSTRVLPTLNFSPGLITNSGPDPFGFTRIFLTWPVLIIQSLSPNSIIAEKAYVIYLYSIILFLAFILSRITLLLLNKHSTHPLLGSRAESFQFAVVLLCFTNFWAIENLSGFFYTYFIEFMLFAISFVLIAYSDCSTRSVMVSGALLSLSVYLDPDLYLFGVIVVSIAVLSFTLSSSSILRSSWSAISRIASIIVITLPNLITVLYVLSQTTGTSFRGPSEYLARSTNLTLDNTFRLLGYWWSTIMFASPEVIWNPSLATQSPTIGSPPYILLTSTFISVLWLTATWSAPLVAAAALRLRTFRNVTVPLALLALVSFHLTSPVSVSLLKLVFSGISLTPTIDNAFSTVFGILDHALILTAISYALLCSVTIFSIMSTRHDHGPGSSPNNRETRMKSLFRSRTPVISAILILFLLAFPSWQLFSGSFYPASSIGTEGLASVGAFSPSNPPPEMLQVYDWLLVQPNGFNVYWPGSNFYSYPWSQKSTPSFTVVDSPKPTFQSTQFSRDLSLLISQNMTWNISGYLAAMNMRYLITQPLSPGGMILAWGISDLSMVQGILQHSPGMQYVMSRGEISVFENKSLVGNISSVDAVYGTNVSETMNPVFHEVFASMRRHIALVPSSVAAEQICVDQLTCSVAVLTPGFVASTLVQALTIGALNGSVVSSQSTVLREGGRFEVPGSSLWSVNNWGPGLVNVEVSGSSMRWAFTGNPTLVSTSYNGAVTENRAGGVEVLDGAIPVLDVGFNYKTSEMFDSTMEVAVPVLDDGLKILSVPISQHFPRSSSWTRASYHVVLPLGTAYFTARIETKASSGWIELKNIEMQTRFLEESPKTPFRLSVPIDGNQTLRLTGNVRFQYQGTGSIGSGTIALSLVPTEQLTWSSEIESSGIIWVSGNMAISEMFVSHIPLATIPLQEIATDNETYVIVTSQTNIVLARPFAPGYRLTDEKQTFSPVATIEGLNLFQNVTSGNYHIDFSPLQVIQVTYSATLVFSFSLLLVLSGGTARLGINSGLMLKRLRSIVKLGPKSSKGRQTALS